MDANRMESARFPSHVAWPWTLALRTRDGVHATALLVYAANRLLRLALMLRDGADAARLARFSDLTAALLRGPEDEPTGHSLSGLRDEVLCASLQDLLAAGEMFLEPYLAGRPDEAQSLAGEVEGSLRAGAALFEGWVVTADSNRRDLVEVWAGPRGLGPVRAPCPDEGRATLWWEAGSDARRRLGPATDTDPPRPLLALPGPGWWEDPEGAVFGADGRAAAPSPGLSPMTALGRLLAWHLPEGGDPVALAAALAEARLPEAGAEVVLVGRGIPLTDLSAEQVAEVRGFLCDHHLDAHLAATDALLVSALQAEEARRRDAEDWKGVADVLLLRQQVESGPAKTVTLVRLANLFTTRLSDAEAAFFCLRTAVEANPSDPDLVSEMSDAARAAGQANEAGRFLLTLARSATGKARGELAREAASLLADTGGDDREAREALTLALEADPEDHDLLRRASEVAARLKDDAWLERILRARKAAAPDRASRIEATLALAVLLHERPERADDAAAEYREALALDPGNAEVFEALCALYATLGRHADVRTLCEETASRLLDPAARLWVLRRLAAHLREHHSDDLEAEARVLAEIAALEPGDRAVLERLAEVYESLGDLVRFLLVKRRLVEAAPDQAVAHLLAMSDAALKGLQDPVAAMGFLVEAARREPDHPDPPRRLREVHESLGLWAEVAHDLEAQAARLEGDARTDLLVRLADVCLERLAQRERAKAALWKALEGCAPARVAGLARRLATWHHEDGEVDRERQALEVAARALGDDEAAADVHTALGRLALLPPTPDPAAARAHFERAVALNPLHPEAVERLVELLIGAGEPASVVALVDPLARKAAGDDLALERRLRLVGAAAALQAGDVSTAAEWYERAVDLDPSDARTRVVLGRVLAQVGRDADALKTLGPVLSGAPEALIPMDRREALETAAGCAARQGDHRQALAYLDQAYSLRGATDLAALRALVKTAEQAGDGRRVAYYLERLVGLEPQGPERFANKMRLGDVYREVWKDPRTALHWYLEAAYEGTSPRTALIKALEVAVGASMHDEAREVLERLIDVEQDGRKRARYHFALAAHLRDHLGDRKGAQVHLWSALELDADLEEAVTALEALLEAEHDHEDVATLYQWLARRDRLTGRTDRLVQTLDRLATLYVEKLDNPALAAETLGEVLQMNPDDPEVATRLAAVLTRMPGREAEALKAHRRVVALDPTHVESYRAIRDLCVLTKDRDGAWCAASALVVLGVATEAEHAAFEAGRQPSLTLRRDSLPPDAFDRLIRDAAADAGMAQVFAILKVPLLRILRLKTLRDLGFGDADRVDMTVRAPLQNMAAAASKVLGIPLPPMVRAAGKSGIAKLPVNPPALAVGDDVAMAWRGRELRFGLARALVTFAPGFEMAGISDAASMRLFFLAGLRVAFPDLPLPEDAVGIEDMAREIGAMLSPESRTTLVAVLTEFRRAHRAIDLRAFLEGVDRTASRAGLFLCNDLKVAGVLLQEDVLFVSDLEFGDRLTDLCAYAVSESYAELRRLMLKT